MINISISTSCFLIPFIGNNHTNLHQLRVDISNQIKVLFATELPTKYPNDGFVKPFRTKRLEPQCKIIRNYLTRSRKIP